MSLKRVALCLLPVVAAGVVYGVLADASLPIARFEFAGDAATARELTAGRVEAFRDSLAADYVFIAGYVATLVLASLAGWPGRRLGIAGAACAVGAGILDVVENVHLALGLSRWEDALFARAALASGVKFALVGAALVIGVTGLVRVARGRSRTPAVTERGTEGAGVR
ncbi:hypothetical protein [Actinocorallia longicatena]|uniref:DUF1772 domain-containing protein n=1 Tax=Actinocorallia longicatena TaxID=111803 RepID=A0ABP6Q0N4_9ACTN